MRGAVIQDDALGLDRDGDVAGLVGAVAHEGAQDHPVTDAEEAGQGVAHEQGLRDEQLALALADERPVGDGAGAGAPGGGVIRQVQVKGGPPAGIRCELSDPERGVLEVGAHRGLEAIASGLPESDVAASRIRHLGRRRCRFLRHVIVGHFEGDAATVLGTPFAPLAFLDLAERLVQAVDRDAERRGGAHSQAAFGPESGHAVASDFIAEGEDGLVDHGHGDIRLDGIPLGVRYLYLVADGLAGGGRVAVRLDADIEAARFGGDGELDVAHVVAGIGVVRGGRPVEDDADVDIGNVPVLDADAEDLAVRLEAAHIRAEDSSALDRHEPRRAGEGGGHQHLGDIAHLVGLAVGDQLEGVVLAHGPGHVVAAADPDEAGGTGDATLVVGRLGHDAVGSRRRRRDLDRCLAVRVRGDGLDIDLGVLRLAAVGVAAVVGALLEADPLALVEAHGHGALRGDAALVVDGHEVDRGGFAGAGNVGLGLDARVPGGGVDEHTDASRDRLRVRIGPGRTDGELLRALVLLDRGGHVEAGEPVGVGGRLAPAAQVGGRAAIPPPEVVALGEGVVLIVLDADLGGNRLRGPLDGRVGDRRAEEEGRLRLRRDRIPVHVVGRRRCELDLELGHAEFGHGEGGPCDVGAFVIGNQYGVGPSRRIGWEHLAGAERSQVAEGGPGRGQRLVASVPEPDIYGGLGGRERVGGVVLASDNRLEVDRFPGPVDGPVRECMGTPTRCGVSRVDANRPG